MHPSMTHIPTWLFLFSLVAAFAAGSGATAYVLRRFA